MTASRITTLETRASRARSVYRGSTFFSLWGALTWPPTRTGPFGTAGSSFTTPPSTPPISPPTTPPWTPPTTPPTTPPLTPPTTPPSSPPGRLQARHRTTRRWPTPRASCGFLGGFDRAVNWAPRGPGFSTRLDLGLAPAAAWGRAGGGAGWGGRGEAPRSTKKASPCCSTGSGSSNTKAGGPRQGDQYDDGIAMKRKGRARRRHSSVGVRRSGSRRCEETSAPADSLSRMIPEVNDSRTRRRATVVAHGVPTP